jgi:predicted  nucleic acid-binding Zn-ribbon protein
MNEAIQLRTPKAVSRIWVALKRTLTVIVILIATIGFLANAAGLVGIWVARRPARDAVTALSTLVNSKLRLVDQALARVSARADESREALVRVNSVASMLGDRLDQGSPLLTELVTATRDELAPKIAETRAQAAALRDAVVSVNAALEMLDSLAFINVPTFGDELNTVSERVDAAQGDVQELSAAVEETKTAASANVVAALTARTMKIDNRLAQIKSMAVKFQATVSQKQHEVAHLSRTLLRVINLLVVSLSALCLMVAVSQVLLIYVCWQYVRRGKLPSLRASRV